MIFLIRHNEVYRVENYFWKGLEEYEKTLESYSSITLPFLQYTHTFS